MPLKDTDVEPRGKGQDLVVLLHGYQGPGSTRSLSRALAEALPDADLLAPTYSSGPLQNGDLRQVAAAVESAIDAAYGCRARAGRPYQKVYLVGFSLGALLARIAYVFALGSTEDHPVPQPQTMARDWAGRVERIVLLAGLNRGWCLAPRPPGMSRKRKALLAAALLLARLTATARLLRCAQRGSPTVANLRIQWIRLSWSRVGMAPVLQLVGTMDDLVAEGDSRDLSTVNTFLQIPVVETGHRTLTRFDGTFAGKQRRDKFVEAMTEPMSRLRSRYSPTTGRAAGGQLKRIDHLVFVLHGIRDVGGWRMALAQAIEATGRAGRVRASRPGYAYFPMGAFLLMNRRQRLVRAFVDWYAEALAEYPRAQISVVGHSNATYIAAQALQRYRTVRFHRLVFAGSVVPRDFPWDRYVRQEHRVTAVRNYLASKDWVVAIFPRLFELAAELTGLRALGFGDIGTGGFNGFLDSSGNDNEVRIQGRHSAALSSDHHCAISRFLVLGEDGSGGPDAPQSSLVSLLSRMCLLVWAALVAAVVALGWGFAHAAAWLTGLPPLVGVASFLAFVLMLLLMF